MLLDQLSTLSHAARMQVFQLLMRRFPDAVPAGEIADVLGFKASTTSVYLSALAGAGLIVQRRVGTSRRYAVDLDGAHGMVSALFLDCCNGRPDLCPPAGLHAGLPGALVRSAPADRPLNVLFVCTGNSARSIVAEALLRRTAGARFAVFSAGTEARAGIHPMVAEMLGQKGFDVSLLHAKPVAEFQGAGAPVMDFVFTVCDRAANTPCPPWQGPPISAHWGLPDPARATGTHAQRQQAFQGTFDAMHKRITAFAALPLATLSRAAVQHEVDAIGRIEELT